MSERMIRIERRVSVGGSFGAKPEDELIISTLVAASADRFDVSKAVVALDRLAPLFDELSPCCGVPIGVVHHPDCRLIQGRDLIGDLHAEMETELAERGAS